MIFVLQYEHWEDKLTKTAFSMDVLSVDQMKKTHHSLLKEVQFEFPTFSKEHMASKFSTPDPKSLKSKRKPSVMYWPQVSLALQQYVQQRFSLVRDSSGQ